MPAHPSTVGPYVIESELGRGGMGIVYAARDDRLGRRVALKAIAPHLANEPERLARFEREVRLLASVTHPNIATVHGLEEDHGARYMVMELVEGSPLSAIIDQRRLAVDEAISYCAQIAGAIEAAHAAGIIHRDLKPSNVIIREDGTAKVLDFGLARSENSSSISSDSIPTASLRIDPVTREGVALGTPNYMSPEQARGRSVSKATDIFSFGCVLYECLAGRRAFDGDTPTDAIAALIERDADVSLLPPHTPHRVRLILERCLRKDARERLRDIGDARLELETALRNREWTTTQLNLAAAPEPRRSKFLRILKAAAFVIAGGAIAWWASVRSVPEHTTPEPIRFTIDLPTEARLGLSRAMNAFDISPDGRTIAYIYEPPDAEPELHIRSLNSFDHRVLTGVRQPRGPAFSPDGKWIAYLDNFEHFKRIPVAGGPTQLIGTPKEGATVAHGPLLWLDDAHIAYTDGADTIHRISLDTGTTTLIAEPQGELLGFTEPVLTPNPNAILASSWAGTIRSANCVSWIDLPSGKAHAVLRRATNPQVVADRYVLFNRDGAIWAIEFDFKTAQAIGEPRLVLPGVACSSWDNAAQYRLSRDGDLVFAPGRRQGVGRRLVLADQTGALTPAIDFDGSLMDDVAMSADGTQIAWTSLDDRVELWVADLTTGTRQRYQPDGEVYEPVFAADGKQMYVILINDDGTPYAETLDLNTGTFTRIPEATWKYIATPTPDGTLLGTIGDEARTNFDIIRFHPEENWRTEPFIVTASMEWLSPGAISPDGQWLLYGSTKSGRGETYIREYPDGDRDWRLPLPGADRAVWSRDGSTIFIASGDAVPGYHKASFSVDEKSGAPIMGEPELLFFSRSPIQTAEMCVTPDDRLLIIDLADWEKEPGRLNVILNWSTELERLFDDQ